MSRLVYETSTTSKRSLWPPEHSDLWVVDCKDAKLKLSNGHWYDDWASALGAQTLGYSYFGSHLFQFQPAASLPWRVEEQFAEQFCTAMNTETVRFFKSGSDAVSCAVRLARAWTNRTHIIMFNECYHGTASEFKPIAWHWAGYPNQPAVSLPFGDMLDNYFLDDTAAIVLEPAPKSVLLPPDGWLQHLREVCDANGILLISDEVILGYRAGLRGYMDSAGVRADLSCYGKAMGQGAAISACTGRADILGLLAKEVHFSGTNNGEPLPLMLASRVLAEYKRNNICEQLSDAGLYLQELLHDAGFQTRGLPGRFEVVLEDRTSTTRALWAEGVLFPGFCSMSVKHTKNQMQLLLGGLQRWRESTKS